jgi:hypothetical protein
VEPVGLIAIGNNATGIIAVGQLATGVVAIGQLARGCIVGGQLALGLVSFGQVSVGVCWSAGLVGVGAFSGPGFILDLFGRFPRRPVRRTGTSLRIFGKRAFDRDVHEDEPGRAAELAEMSGTGRSVRAPALEPWRVAVGMALMVAIAAGWWFGAGAAVVEPLTSSDGILINAPQER